MEIGSPHLSKTTLNANGLNSPIKRARVAKLIFFKKTRKPIFCLQETVFRHKDTHRLQVK